MPSIAQPRTNLPQPPCNHRREFSALSCARPHKDVTPALGKQFLDIVVTQRVKRK
jgi:hypothetical protein